MRETLLAMLALALVGVTVLIVKADEDFQRATDEADRNAAPRDYAIDEDTGEGYDFEEAA